MTRVARAAKEDGRKVEGGGPAVPGAAGRQALIDGLNHDLAGEYRAILMDTHYSARLTGPYPRKLRALFQAEVVGELGHAQFLADKAAALGGDPTCVPRSVPEADRPRQMLEQALMAERQATADHGERIRQAEAFGDHGPPVLGAGCADLAGRVAEAAGDLVGEELGPVVGFSRPTEQLVAAPANWQARVPARARYCDEVLARFTAASIDLDALATQLQDDGARSFDKSWNELPASIASAGEMLKRVS